MAHIVNFKIPTMLTIKETAIKTGLAEHYIRLMANANQIIHVRCGNKYLINLEKFIEFLNTSKGYEKVEQTNKFGISPVKL